MLGALLAIYIVNFADRYLISGLVGPIKAEFGLSDSFMGLLMGPAFVVLYVLMGVPLARMADRGSRIRIIAAGCVMWSVATMASGFATGPISLALARIGVGIGEAAFVAPAYSLLADYFRVEKRGLALAILGLATYLGQILGQGGGPAIAAASSWRMAFWLIGAAGVVLGLLALVLVREPPRGLAARSEAAAVSFRQLLGLLWQSRSMRLMIAAFSLGMLSGVAFGYWAPELYARNFQMDPVVVKSVFAINFGLAGLVGMFAFGLLADRLSVRGMHWPVFLAGLAMGSATLFTLMATWAPQFSYVSLLAIPSGLLGGGWSVGLHATVQHVLPPSMRASGTALYLAIATLVGQIAGPFAVGLISDSLGGDAAALRLAMTLVMPLGFVGALCAILASRHVVADQKRLAELA